MTAITAQPSLTKTPGDVLPVCASFVAELTGDDVLTGTPTVTVTPSGPVVSAAAVNTEPVLVEIEGNRHWAQAGQAVLFLVAGGTDGQTYSLLVSCDTEAVEGRFDQRPITLVVSDE